MDAEHGRGSVAVLTDAGYAKVAAIAPGHVAAVRSAVFDALSPRQLDELEGICTTLLQFKIRDELGDGPASSGQALVGHRGHLEDDTDSSRARPHDEDIRASAETQADEDLTAGLVRISDARSAVDFTELQLIDRALSGSDRASLLRDPSTGSG